MLKKMGVSICLALLLSIMGCEKAPMETLPMLTEPAETTSVPTTVPQDTSAIIETTMPPETTAPTETTVPPETTVPTEPTILAEHIVVEEAAFPAYDLKSGKNFVISQEKYNGFRVDHVHMGTGTSYSMMPFDFGCLWVCTSDPEFNTGNRYELWAIENGKVKKLDSKVLSMDVTAMGKTLEMHTEYVSHNGKVIFSHIPAEPSAFIVSAEDSRRWVVQLTIDSEKGFYRYWVLLDPETGKITEFLQNFDINLLHGKLYSFVTWADGGFIARIYGDGFYFFNTEKGTITENYPYENPEEPEISIAFRRYTDTAFFVDPFDDETVDVQMPEGWDDVTYLNWSRSYDGRMLYAARYNEQGKVQKLLVFDGRTNRLYEISRSGFSSEMRDEIGWSHDNRLVISTEDNKEISIYTFEGP